MKQTIATIHASSWINGMATTIGHVDKYMYNPSRLSELVGHLHYANTAQVEEAEAAAHTALKQWKAMTGEARGAVLYQMANKLEEHKDELAQLASREMGKPIKEMTGEVGRGIQLLRYYAGEGVRAHGDVIPSSQHQVLQYKKHVPLGVVGVITPWNFPVAIPIWKIAPALICGNTIVWKPAEQASLSAFRLCEIFKEAGLPDGVINMVLGKGQEVGRFLVEKANIQCLSFTGSTVTGTTIASTCAARNIKYQTEMGGKNAAVVMPSADLKSAAAAIASGAFRSAGQKCTATSRVYVHEDVQDAFLTALKAEMTAVKLRPADDPSCYLGPVASKVQFDHVTDYINMAQTEATVLYENDDTIQEDGYYIRPLIVTGVDNDHPLMTEEIFGPVVVVKTFSSYDEVISFVNASDYGLSGSIFTTTLDEAHRFLDDANIGMVRVNLETAGVEYQAPFGGMKQSSSHTREQGQAALQFFTNVKTCAVKF
ncbi:aldehyde dehydrogenase (NAD+) [Shouchella lonarensis]|uniref:Aldehyde dehydrogenase (NAD+) n=1 Tax=Shouchella lonarensis TaxID=1464122 RepID=A0A1G6JTM9_9BACI|nr:aldehyde dehydrogenase family protein [Shouchella lonarensis]SDC22028.1 aldehyde dehydrogenase (NAD+) [Shouchella lonarensis]